MKTFSSLKKFFSLDDAARYFSLTLNEDVTVKDILESALEENITLSIKFENSVSLKTNKLRPVTQQELERYKYIAMDQTKISPDLKILTEDADRLVYLDGIFDIPVLNNCNVDNEIIPMKLQKILNPDKRKDSPSNFIVNRESEYYAIVTEYLPKNEDGMSYIELEDDRPLLHNPEYARKYFHKPFSLPEVATIGVTRQNIDSFISKTTNQIEIENLSKKRSKNSKMDDSLLLIIGALLSDAGIDCNSIRNKTERSKVANMICEKIDLIGCTIDPGTVNAKLLYLPDVVDKKRK